MKYKKLEEGKYIKNKGDIMILKADTRAFLPEEIEELEKHTYGLTGLLNEEVKYTHPVKINPIVNTMYGCKGWTIEEILQDVMGMKDTRSALYKEYLEKFNSALQDDNMDTARSIYEKLNRMLHPDNVLRKVLEIQLIGG